MIECKCQDDGVMIKVQGMGKEIMIETASIITMCYETMRVSGFPEEKANSLLISMVFAAVEEYNNKNDGGDEPNDASV